MPDSVTPPSAVQPVDVDVDLHAAAQFTTFSTYVVEVQDAVAAGATRLALAYLGGTLAAAVVAVLAGSALASTLIRVLTRASRHGSKER
jgi:CrcB protein